MATVRPAAQPVERHCTFTLETYTDHAAVQCSICQDEVPPTEVAPQHASSTTRLAQHDSTGEAPHRFHLVCMQNAIHADNVARNHLPRCPSCLATIDNPTTIDRNYVQQPVRNDTDGGAPIIGLLNQQLAALFGQAAILGMPPHGMPAGHAHTAQGFPHIHILGGLPEDLRGRARAYAQPDQARTASRERFLTDVENNDVTRIERIPFPLPVNWVHAGILKAVERGHLQIIQMLCDLTENSAILDQALALATVRDRGDIVRFLLTTPVSIYALNQALLDASRAQKAGNVRILLERKQNLSQDTKNHALLISADNLDRHTMHALLEECGFSPDAISEAVVHCLATQKSYDQTAPLLTLLIEMGRLNQKATTELLSTTIAESDKPKFTQVLNSSGNTLSFLNRLSLALTALLHWEWSMLIAVIQNQFHV